MRRIALPLIVTLGLTPHAEAQVSVDLRALDAPAAKPLARPASPAPVQRPVAAAPRPPQKPPAVAPKPVAAAPPFVPAAKAPVEPSPPPPPVLPTALPAPPPAAMVAAPPAPPERLPEPVRLTFLYGETGLSATDEAAIRALAQSIHAPSASSVNVVAYAAGSPDDPSTARRVSLSRGMAVRSVLIANGVPSSQIYVRALGAAAADGPADRVELIVARIGAVTR